MIPALQDNGLLPLGRYPSTPEEVAGRFAPPSSPQRQAMWAEWVELTDLIRSTVGELPAVWLGGSFVTSKEKPGDIDSVYLLKLETVLKLSDFQKSVLEVIVDGENHGHLGVISPYIIFLEEMQDGTTLCKQGDASISLLERGYWDQLWSRTRECHNPAYPACGYLEVIIDGYQ